jgi:hypothetical protein
MIHSIKNKKPSSLLFHLFSHILLLLTPFFLLMHPITLHTSPCTSPTFVPRSQGRHKVRQIAGLSNLTHLNTPQSWYGTLSIAPGYSASFKPHHIAQSFFGNSIVNNADCDTECASKINIQGSEITGSDRDPKAWLADNFYLAPDYNGSFTITPRIKNFFIDFDFYLGLNEWICGAYARLYAPFVHTRWNVNLCESFNTTHANYPAGYFAPQEVINNSATSTTPAILKSFGSYSNGAAPTIDNIYPQPLLFAKIDRNRITVNGIAEVRAELGWDFLQSDWYHLGLNIQAAAPTGTSRRAQFAFEALVGNGKHWEIGAGATAHCLFWQDSAQEHQVGLYADATVTTLLKNYEHRTFDLKNKPNSRYMLAAKMGPNTQELMGDGELASNQFVNAYAPVANLTTFNITVSNAVQADIVAWLNYTAYNWSIDVGYNFYYRSSDKYTCPQTDCNSICGISNICDASQANRWVLKGDARVYGFTSTATAVPLSVSEHAATICSGTNAAQPASSIDPLYRLNAGVDNAQIAALPSGDVFFDTAGTATISTSIQPLFISCNDVDFVKTKALSNALFMHVSYTWDKECYDPFLGMGFFAEFGRNNTCPDNKTCNNSSGCTSTPNSSRSNITNTSLSLWGVWVKGGIAFE